MSLKIWLPLTGTLENKGISDASITNNGATVSTSGKIGSCYSFDGTNDYLAITSFKPNQWPEISISFWCKATTHLTGFFCIRGTSSNAGTLSVVINANGFNFRDTVSTSLQTIAWPDTFPAGVWTHITCIYKQGEIFIYFNGELKVHDTSRLNTNRKLDVHSSATVRIGRQQTTSANYYYNGQLNDFRIYDHVLSAAEVKEIAQGLVLHYKFAEPNPNLLKTTPRSYSSSSYNAYSIYLTEKLIADQTYTVQLWDVDVAHSAKSASSLGISIYWGGGSVQLKRLLGTSYFTNGHADYICTTITPTTAQVNHSHASNLWLVMYNSPPSATGTRSMHIGAWKLEKGTVATPWIDSKETITEVQDSSGYNYNGTIVGSITNQSSTPRYSTALYMDNTNTSNHIETNIISLPTMTVSFWVKTNKSTNQIIFADPINAVEFGILNSVAYIKTANAKGWTLNNFITNEWNHIVVQKDGTNYYLYVNGILETQNSSGDNYFVHQGSKLWILNRSYNNNYAGNAAISDFKVYCTKLSINDIKKIYNSSMSIDNLQNIHSYELLEAKNKISINSKGQLTCNELTESTTTKFYDVQLIDTNQIIEI